MASQIGINRIAYINLQGQLATIAPSGDRPRLLTPAGRVFQFPAWAPDGSALAAIGNDRLGSGVFIIQDQPSPGEPLALYYNHRQEPIYLYWAPDSQKVSFIASHPQEGLGLHVADIRESRSHLLTTGRPLFWDWTPDAEQILIHTDLSSLGARLAFIDPQGDPHGPNLAQPGAFQAPGIARSGRWWAYAEVDEFDNNQLVVQGPEGVEGFTLAHHGLLALGWCPTDTDWLAFISPSFPAQRFYGYLQLVDMATRSVRTLVEDTVLAFFWSPNGRYLAYLTLDRITTASQQEAEQDRSLNRTNGVYRGEGAAPPPPQGTALATTLSLKLWLVEAATGRRYQLSTFAPVPLFVNQFLPFFDQYTLSHRLWSPASDALLLPVMEADTPRIMIWPIDGTSPRVLGDGVMAFWSWQ